MPPGARAGIMNVQKRRLLTEMRYQPSATGRSEVERARNNTLRNIMKVEDTVVKK